MKQSNFEFYNTDKSYQSAKRILNSILPLLGEISSFQDVGSGVGAWSKVLEDLGHKDFKLYDHPSINPDRLLVISKNSFVPIDLDNYLPEIKKFDLSICIEVLEHFEESRALALLNYLTECSDIIIFSAAVPFQKGNGHCNEKNHTYWHGKFRARGFVFFDGFKRNFLNEEIDKESFFYLQNSFLYFRSDKFSFPIENNISSEFFEIRSVYLLNKVHTISDSLKILKNAIITSLKAKLS